MRESGENGPLVGRRCLITGAASGVGAAIAQAFAGAGAALALTDRDAAGLERVANGLSASTHSADMTDANAVRHLVDDAADAHGGLDVLVNCAGILTEVPLVDMDLETWQNMIDADLTSVFLACRAVVPRMLEQRDGRIINVASQLGQKGSAGLTHYSAAKAGVLGFTKALAREVATAGVLVNAIAPGPLTTPMVDGLSAEWKREKEFELPLGRFGSPDEIAPTAVLLASSPGGDLYTGQTLGPNSGDVMA